MNKNYNCMSMILKQHNLYIELHKSKRWLNILYKKGLKIKIG